MIFDIITSLGSSKRDVKRASNMNVIENNKLKLELSDNLRATKQSLVNNAIATLQADETLRLQQLAITQERKKGNIYMFTSFILSGISAFMSVCGLNNTKHLQDCIRDLQSVLITALFFAFAFVNLIISYNKPYNERNYSTIQTKLNILQAIFTATSICSNIIFLRLQHIHIALATILAVLLDMFSIYLCSLANAQRYKHKTLSTDTQQDIFTMCIYIYTHRIKQAITKRYNALYTADLQTLNRDCITANLGLQNLRKPQKTQCFLDSVGEQVAEQTAEQSTENSTEQTADNQEKELLQSDINTDVKADDKTVAIEHKTSNLNDLSSFKHNTVSKIDKNTLYNLIQRLESNTELTPRMFNMQDNRANYYNWIKQFDNVIKRNNTYVRA